MKNYLPIGSVVTLKNGTKKLMIIGRSQVCEGKLYDYSACLFPEGYLGKDALYIFNTDDIGTLYYIGMQNDEEFAFRSALVEAEEKIAKEIETKEE